MSDRRTFIMLSGPILFGLCSIFIKAPFCLAGTSLKCSITTTDNSEETLNNVRLVTGSWPSSDSYLREQSAIAEEGLLVESSFFWRKLDSWKIAELEWTSGQREPDWLSGTIQLTTGEIVIGRTPTRVQQTWTSLHEIYYFRDIPFSSIRGIKRLAGDKPSWLIRLIDGNEETVDALSVYRKSYRMQFKSFLYSAQDTLNCETLGGKQPIAINQIREVRFLGKPRTFTVLLKTESTLDCTNATITTHQKEQPWAFIYGELSDGRIWYSPIDGLVKVVFLQDP